MLAQIDAWRLRFNPGGSESTLEAQIEPWRLRLSPGGSDWSPGADIDIGLLGRLAVFRPPVARYYNIYR